MSLDAQRTKEKHERRAGNERYVYIPKSDSKKLLIVFSFLGATTYHRLRVLSADQRVNLLFLRDRSDDFYSAKESAPRYRRILKRLTRGFEPRNITTYGASMGANGAVFHGLELGANVIAINPIVDWKTSLALSTYDLLRKRLRALGPRRFVNLQELFTTPTMRSAVLCQFNSDPMGRANAKLLAVAQPDYGSLIYEFSNMPVHTAIDEVLGPTGIYQRMALLASLRRVRAPLYGASKTEQGVTLIKARV